MRDEVFKFIRFACVGAIGFATDATIIYFLIKAGMHPYPARVMSFAAALTVTWFANRHWTFKASGQASAHKRFAAYLGVQLTGGTVNFIIYATVLHFIGVSAEKAVLALFIGALFGVFVNFAGARFLVFSEHLIRDRRPDADGGSA